MPQTKIAKRFTAWAALMEEKKKGASQNQDMNHLNIGEFPIPHLWR